MTRSEWKRMRRWLFRFLLAEALLVGVFAWCCAQYITYEPEPEIFTVIRDVPVPVEVTVAPEVSEGQEGPSGAAIALAKAMWGEDRGGTTTEKAAVAWCVLNRVDSDDPSFPDDVISVCAQDYPCKQFDGYNPDYPVEPELLALAEDVLARWELEKLGVGTVGRVLPPDYLYFEGDGQHNYFRREYIHSGETWDWSLESPYEEGQ